MIKEIKKNPMYGYLFYLVVAAAISNQAWNTLFNNYAVDIVGINGFQMGIIQSVREIPGFLTFLVVYILIVIKEHRLSALSTVLMGIGVAITGLFPSFKGLLFTTFLMSLGFHYFETTNKSLTLQHFGKKEAPLVLGRFGSYSAIVSIFFGLMLLISVKFFPIWLNYLVYGIIISTIGLYFLFKNPIFLEVPKQKKGMVLKKKYWLYYALNFLAGARRQIFIAFAVFLLVKHYNFTVLEVAILFVLNNIFVFLTAPKIAEGINRFGERKVLTFEYLALIFIFLGYAFIESRNVALILYIIDHVIFGFAIGINTYFQKTADSEDIAPSMGVGFAINHISAVIVPIIGGILWMTNWKTPFIMGAIFSAISLFFVKYIPKDIKIIQN
ncbi:major facilitator superfamily MFS_1 [Methanococcus vannielii SB]|jgi:MFS family permease|uniref:Major facilitator superfamily MFS_1 n=1 Tax=Methanococcus vannielii (strain ATCC 35089 / DSM 1224 / JCM 13029 / OCM 148 / SB) TaxID=406327 RepID=A6UQ33_METVS|nr:MFS transporter [Methanococcus vannielii]ABR54605.1 major facilitator superfamily MFS_1 [Methanococcus vannielii SB]